MATQEQIKAAATAKIELSYPIYKQLNLLDSVYGEQEINKFRTFRDAVRTRCHDLELNATEEIEPFEYILSLYSDIAP